jgi:hypothetical protein
VRVSLDVGVGMVLAMNRYPLARSYASGDPDNDSKDEGSWLTKSEGPVAESTMEKYGRTGICNDRDAKAEDRSNDEGAEKPIHAGIIVAYLQEGRHQV